MRNPGTESRDEAQVILVIDGSGDLASVLSTALGSDPYRVISASTGQEGLALAAVHKPDLILLEMLMRGMDGFEICERLASDVFLKHIPLIAVISEESVGSRLDEIIGCIDDYISKPLSAGDIAARIRLTLHRARTMGAANPLTRLPGNVQIQEEIMSRIQRREPFALLHIDLDDFKAFNDHYGFLRGDEAIKLLARCGRDAIKAHAPQHGFLGHIGGDDMAAVVTADAAEAVARHIVDTWDEMVPNLYEPEDAERRQIEIIDRRGRVQHVPLASVSIGVASNAIRPLHSHWEASEVAAEMKHVAKSREGSSIAIDRRRQINLDERAEVRA